MAQVQRAISKKGKQYITTEINNTNEFLVYIEDVPTLIYSATNLVLDALFVANENHVQDYQAKYGEYRLELNTDNNYEYVINIDRNKTYTFSFYSRYKTTNVPIDVSLEYRVYTETIGGVLVNSETHQFENTNTWKRNYFNINTTRPFFWYYDIAEGTVTIPEDATCEVTIIINTATASYSLFNAPQVVKEDYCTPFIS